MIDFLIEYRAPLLIVYTLACFWVWALCAIAGQADDEAEKMGKLRRIK